MDNVDKLINDLKSEESKKIFSKIIKERIEREKKRNDRIKTIMSSIDYITWLIDFTKDKEGFNDDDWTYSYEKLSDSDLEKVNELSLFFEGINDYAKINYIYSYPRSFGEYYLIKVGDIGFEIGIMTGQGTLFYCKKTKVDKEYIDYLDILTNRKQDNVSYIKENLDNLSNIIISLYESGVPLDAIIESVDGVINKIVKNEEQKVLKK